MSARPILPPAVLFLALALAPVLTLACAKTTAQPVIVRVPVAVPCPPPRIPPRPVLLVPRLSPSATADQMVKALVADYLALMGALDAWEEVMRAYLPQEGPPTQGKPPHPSPATVPTPPSTQPPAEPQ